MADDIVIRIMTLDDYPAVKKLLTKSFFTGEPICMSSGEDAEKCAAQEIDDYNLELIRCGTSLIALKGNKPVGAVVAGTQVPSDIQKHYDEAQASGAYIWGRLLRFLSKLEREADIYKRYNVNKALYSHITSVDPEMRGNGLGSRLAARLMQVGREKGYPIMLAYCTSFYSARQKEALGMECAYAIDYASYGDEKGPVAFKPPEPHERARVMVIRL